MSEVTYTFNDFITKSQREKFNIFQKIFLFADTLKIKDIYDVYEGTFKLRKLIEQYSYSKDEPIRLQYVALDLVDIDNFIQEYINSNICQPKLVFKDNSNYNIGNMGYTPIPSKQVKKGTHKHQYGALPQLLDFVNSDIPIYFFKTKAWDGSYIMISGKENKRFE